MRTIKMYKTYSFRNKDPIIDIMRTALQDEAKATGISERKMQRIACELSGLSPGTPTGWFRKGVKRPQFASLNAFARAIDYDLTLVRRNRDATRNGKGK
ncbi:hypothetical protein [Collimonas fungivorans]|uniref:hypothetical protein n=1 Tax=Collimonas fungivorans TaxID=158899 RepID=UPI003FA3BBB4